MWELDHKEGWALKNWCFWTVVLEKTLASPLDSKEIQPVNPKGNQPWIFIGRINIEAEAPIIWPPDVKSWLIGKDPDAGKDWGQEGKGATEDEMVGWYASLTRWIWVWNSRRQWRTRKLGVLQSMGSQRVGHEWATDQQQKEGTYFKDKDINWKQKEKKLYHANINQRKTIVTLLISDKEILPLKRGKENDQSREGYYIVVKELIHQEDSPKYVWIKWQNCKISEAKTDRTEWWKNPSL